MGIGAIFGLLGGLALFLYGMQMMSTNLEAAAGSRMKQLLEQLTSNRILGVCVGAGITAVIQSSSATTVMVVGFVNSGLMTLNQAVWIIMGANIGTTVTGQLIALDIDLLAPFITFVGVALIFFVKEKKVQYAGGIISGLGILFIGMGMMSDAMLPLRDCEPFIELMTKFSNPFLGILAGAAFTAVIQSSSASVGILQALAMSGLVNLHSAVFVLFGQNIGTCITAVLAAVGTSRSAKRATVIHLLFNVIGTCIFVAVCLLTPFTAWMMRMTPGNPAAQIANVHTIFNIVTTLLLLPFGNRLALAAGKLLPDRPEKEADEDRWFEELLSSGHVLGVAAIARKQLKEELGQMIQLASVNVEQSFGSILEARTVSLEALEAREEAIDLYNARLSRRISKVLTVEQSPTEVQALRQMFSMLGNTERIGDHAMNLAGYARTFEEKGLDFSGPVKEETEQMKSLCMDAMGLLKRADALTSEKLWDYAVDLEEKIDHMTVRFRKNQIERMRAGHGDIEVSILYSEILTDYERIGDHILNIARASVDMQQH